jgi:hypothetical protein
VIVVDVLKVVRAAGAHRGRAASDEFD